MHHINDPRFMEPITKKKKQKIEIREEYDPITRAVIKAAIKNCKSVVDFNIDEIPPSVNNNYEKNIYKNNSNGKAYMSVSLSPEIQIFRANVRNKVLRLRNKFKTNCVYFVIIQVYTNKWLNKDKTPKKKDIDNPIKPLFDAIEEATGLQDELIFKFYVTKVYSEIEKTKVSIYEMDSSIFTS